jgi:hypothetical protein
MGVRGGTRSRSIAAVLVTLTITETETETMTETMTRWRLPTVPSTPHTVRPCWSPECFLGCAPLTFHTPGGVSRSGFAFSAGICVAHVHDLVSPVSSFPCRVRSGSVATSSAASYLLWCGLSLSLQLFCSNRPDTAIFLLYSGFDSIEWPPGQHSRCSSSNRSPLIQQLQRSDADGTHEHRSQLRCPT